jgi:acyl-CoA reductase-like NAD-dependent aldehyde dehydrogenase
LKQLCHFPQRHIHSYIANRTSGTNPAPDDDQEEYSMEHERQHYVHRAWVDPLQPTLFGVVDPSTEETFTHIAAGGPKDVDRAVAAAQAAAKTVKRVSQELGGKSANILLPDVDFQTAVTKGVLGMMGNSGQSCNAPTRMFVPADRHDEVKAVIGYQAA